MTKQVDKLKQKIRQAKHQSKPEQADLVVRDSNGHWLFEVYGDIEATKPAQKHRAG